ncbi:signal peptidase I [Treponema sp.]|uniref:signal peptidase I n=1 Tax=Treponema sp. TaxID=166 RepID=UPI003F07C0C3
MKQNVGDYSFEYKKRQQVKFMHAVVFFVSVFVFISIFLNCILFSVFVNSSSMETDICRGGIVFVSPFMRNPSRGQVVYLSRIDGQGVSAGKRLVNTAVSFFSLYKFTPFGRNSRMTGNDSIRRVVALPGDSYYMKDFVLYVKPAGQPHFLTEFELSARPYNISIYSVPVEWDGMGCSGQIPETTLGKDEYFVLADNRIEGLDSRIYGVISSSRIKGRVLCQVFPFGKAKLF